MHRKLTAALSALALAACATPPDVAPPNGAPAEESPTSAPPASYDAPTLLAKPLPEIADALASGEVTSVQLTQAYLDRIAALDRAGPRLQSIITLNPDALEQAAAADARRANGQTLSPLDGVSILLKDNIESLDPMPTTAGSLALADNLTGRDSPRCMPESAEKRIGA